MTKKIQDLVKKWDEEVCLKHCQNQINEIINFFKKDTKLFFLDIGANVGKFHEALSNV